MTYDRRNEVLHLCNNFDSFFIDFFDNLINKDKDIIHRVYYFRERERGKPSLNLPSYVKLSFSYSKFDKLFFRNRSKKIINDILVQYNIQDISIVHAHTLFTNGYLAYKLNQKHDIPYIVAIRSTDIDMFLKYRKDLFLIAKRILENAQRVIFISYGNRDALLNYNYLYKNTNLKEKSLIIPNGVSNFYLDNLFKIRKRPSSKKTIRILTVGLICKRKNQLEVASAIENLVKMGYKIEYTIVGRVLDEGYFNLLKKFSFITHIPHIDKKKLLTVYRNHDIYAMPSKSETFGITYIEAMTQGLPLIYSKGNGIDQFFEEFPVGCGVSNKEEILLSYEKIMRDYEIFSRNAINNSMKFRWEDLQEKYVDVYRNIK